MENTNSNYSEKVVAFLRKDGVYNGNEYHNYVLVTVIYNDGVPVNCDCKSYKFRQKDIKEVTGFDCPDLVVGTYIKKPYFDKFGRLCGIDYCVGDDDE